MISTPQTTHDPIARLGIGALVAGYFVLALAAPAKAEPIVPGRADFAPRISTQAQPTQPLPTVAQPTAQAAEQPESAEPPAPAVEQPGDQVAAGGEAPAPAPAEQPAVVAAPVDEARPVQHDLAPKAADPAPPQAVQPGDGAILLQANDEASFQNILEGEGSKPAQHKLP
jgi:hypothetical protein